MTAAAFQATFADWKLIKTRKCVQIVFEVPLEAADAAYQVLGGMPDPSVSAWFGIAKLQPTKGGAGNAQMNNETPRQETKTGGARSWDSMTAAQQAGILCADKAFQKFISERWSAESGGVAIAEGEYRSTQYVRQWCNVESRSEIPSDPTAIALWVALVSDYRSWQQHPELVG